MKKKKFSEAYEFNVFTMYIRPVEYGSKLYSQIGETDDKYLFPFKPQDIIKHSCIYFGSNYNARREAAKEMMGFTRKAPIAIEPSLDIFVFPTSSPENPECIWISLLHVEDYSKISSQQIEVLFSNKQTVVFNIPFTTFRNQMQRTALFRAKLLQRIERKGKKKTLYLINRPKKMKASETSREYIEREKDHNPK
ncbi:competence protein ComK [Bacillus sp. SORGH_AS 510]|uniref:competence protein ComK n=1 Tax=Bacillus sp. SORGH_AS_0510 TaxID=3041771 RepID=UPI00277D4803|nr:competence protein ComK [Bacillus sp. SORGH_AS_0510]MDQ1147160.1 competence protein ComK [Bacillus sp. SORGH_AS_0510]